VKPAVGFTLPSAGVTPAPSGRKSRNVETPFRPQVPAPCRRRVPPPGHSERSEESRFCLRAALVSRSLHVAYYLCACRPPIFVPVASCLCVILSEAKNPGSLRELLGCRSLHLASYLRACRFLSLCHSERSEESRIFLDARRRVAIEGALAVTEKDPGLFAALRMTQQQNPAEIVMCGINRRR